MQVSMSDLKELLCGQASGASCVADFGSPYKIVVLDKGFVVHGRVTRSGSYIVIDECKCIRFWGTPSQDSQSGLGYLADRGPTKTTKLDPQPQTRVHELQVVQMIDAKGAWNAS